MTYDADMILAPRTSPAGSLSPTVTSLTVAARMTLRTDTTDRSAAPPAPDGRAVFQTLDRTARFPYPRGEYARRFAWRLVQATVYRLPLPRAYAWRRFWLRLFGARLGTAAA